MEKLKVWIDAGHGGRDPGAVGGGLQEKDIALSVSLKLGKYLESIGLFEVAYSRTTDVFVALSPKDGKTRMQYANGWGADVVISIHCNSFDNTTAIGLETYSYPGSKKGLELSTAIYNALVKAKLYNAKRGTKTANFAMVRDTKAVSCLIELAFISNAKDRELLIHKQDEFAVEIGNGIINYFGLTLDESIPEEPKEPLAPITPSDKVKVRIGDKVKEIRRIEKDQENYLHVREFMGFLGHKVDWDEAKQEIVIDGDDVKPSKEITGYGKYYKTEHLEVVETYPSAIYAQFVGGKTCRQTGAYCGSGVFFDMSTAPVTNSRSIVAIAVNGGKPIGENAHTADYTNRYKRGAIVTRPDGTAEFMRINNINEISGEYVVVLGGVSMGEEYNPTREGYIPANKNDDVLRDTMHTALACKKDRVYYITSLGNCTLAKFNEYIMKELGLEYIVGLDGGGSSQLYFEGNKGKHSTRKLPMVIGFKKIED